MNSTTVHMNRAHSFPRKILPNSTGQIAKFQKIVQIPQLVTALHFMTENWELFR